jgi:glutathione S-transferase
MKLYDGGRAPNPRRVRIFLAEKGISVPLEPVDFAALQQRSEEFAQLNPMRRVPVLVLDDGTAISESVAICRYFDALYPEPPLFGKGAVGIALVEMWNRRAEFNLFQAVSFVFRHTSPSMKAMETPQVPDWAEANKPRILDFLRLLDSELRTRDFIAGDDYSIADITALCAIDFMKAPKLPVPGELTHLHRWHAQVSARPSAKA